MSFLYGIASIFSQYINIYWFFVTGMWTLAPQPGIEPHPCIEGNVLTTELLGSPRSSGQFVTSSADLKENECWRVKWSRHSCFSPANCSSVYTGEIGNGKVERIPSMTKERWGKCLNKAIQLLWDLATEAMPTQIHCLCDS